MVDVDAGRFANLGRFLERADLLVLTPDERTGYFEEWREIDSRERDLDDRLVVGLVGGTGVGKSTFINALARDAISKSGDRRPTTDRVVAYRHRDTDVPDDLPRADLSEPQVLHDNASLARVVVLDFPDFDSVEAGHRDILLRHLPFLDVLFIVVDDVKYGDRRLFELLRDLRHDPQNLFVILNKVDRLVARYGADGWRRVAAEILDDLHEKLEEHAALRLEQQQLRAVSALGALDLARGECASAPTPDAIVDGDFESIRALLNSYREDKRRREAKRLNLGSRRRELFDALRRHVVGGEPPRVAARAAEHVESWRIELDGVLAGMSQDVLTAVERRAVRSRSLRAAAPHYGVPLSLVFTLLGEWGSWRSRGAATAIDSGAFASRIVNHYRAYLDGLENLRATVDTEFAAAELPVSVTAAVADASSAAGRSGDWATGVASRLEAALNRPLGTVAASGESGGDPSSSAATDRDAPALRRRWPWHMPALLVALGGLWSIVYPPLAAVFSSDKTWADFLGELVGSLIDALNPTFLIGLVGGVVLAYFATALYVWIRESQRLDEVTGATQELVRDEIRRRGADVFGAVETLVGRFRGEIGELEQIVGKGDSDY